MRLSSLRTHAGNALICALFAIIIVYSVGASVLMNCTTRYNAASNQVRAYKESLHAAESGGDIAFNEVRKSLSDPLNAFTTGWSNSIAVSAVFGGSLSGGFLSLSGN